MAETLPPLDAWQVSGMRVTAFPAEPTKIDAPSWWIDLLGHPPETQVIRPKIGQRQEEGEHEGRKLSLQVQPERIDWVLSPVVKLSEEEPENLPLAGPFPETLNSFLEVVMRWLTMCPPLTRLAFGAVLAQPVKDRQTGYLHIAKYLHHIRLDPESSDFFYQINRARPSRTGINDLRINRLSKWSVLLFQRLTVTLEKTSAKAVEYTGLQSACRLELDINTAPDFPGGTLPQDRLSEVLDELVGMANEIAALGDVP